MKTSLRRLTKASLLVTAGATLYLAIPIAERWMAGEPAEATGDLVDSPLAQIQVEGAEPPRSGRDARGNLVVAQCLLALERRQAISADIVQSGRMAGQVVETSGHYLQKGRGDARQFSLLLQGRIGGSSARVWQVSDGRIHWTDIAWNADRSPDRRQVKRIDLRKVRRELYPGADDEFRPAPGDAAINSASAAAWFELGGLPMLVGSLAEKFDFGAPRQMYLRNAPVYTMIGHWKPAQRQALLTSVANDNAKEAKDAQQPPEAKRLPERMPDHVLIAVGMKDLFPHLIEYRGPSDPLSARGLAEDNRFRQSTGPMFKLDFLRPRFDDELEGAISDRHFAYELPEGVPCKDVTSQRIALIDRHKLASSQAATSSGPRR